MVKKLIAAAVLSLSAATLLPGGNVAATINIGDRAKQINCLALAIYKESSGEPFLGQVAVARVVVNRVLHGFAADPCGVVYQSAKIKKPDGKVVKICQFSWACNRNAKIGDKTSFLDATAIATDVFDDNRWSDVIPNNTLFFHNTSVQPSWKYKRLRTIGNHVFYSRGKKKYI